MLTGEARIRQDRGGEVHHRVDPTQLLVQLQPYTHAQLKGHRRDQQALPRCQPPGRGCPSTSTTVWLPGGAGRVTPLLQPIIGGPTVVIVDISVIVVPVP